MMNSHALYYYLTLVNCPFYKKKKKKIGINVPAFIVFTKKSFT